MYSLTFREFNSIKNKLKDAIIPYCRSIYDSTCNFDIEAHKFGFKNLVSDDDQVGSLYVVCEFGDGSEVAAEYIILTYDSINNCWTCTNNTYKGKGLNTIINNTIKQMRYKNLSDSVNNTVTTREIEELFD